MRKQIVVADDDPTMRSALYEVLRAAGYDVVQCPSGEQASLIIQQGGVDLVISDVRMPGVDGLELLRSVRTVSSPPPFIMMSGYATVLEAVEAMKMGAYDFLVKPFFHHDLLALADAALCQEKGQNEEPAVSEPSSEFRAGEIVTTNPQMRALLKLATDVARSRASVLVQGESGTGKEIFARFIHTHSRRGTGPFVAVNCAALPEGLLESELFGYEHGAFTGAVGSKPGKFELADTGTMLLDEVSEMPLPLQAKLLRVLQEREVDRVGGRKPARVDIRVIATTNRDLREMIHAGTFREDLFYRLDVIPFRLPPLRDRIEDIEPLARSFFTRNGYKGNGLSPTAVARLKAHPWRGNIRELFNVLERATILAGGETIGPEHLLLEEERPRDFGKKEYNVVERGPVEPRPLIPSSPVSGVSPSAHVNEYIRAGLSVQEMEEMLIRKTLLEV
ncbi:MAG: sigma-54-dependent transcriptional regulator, partial [Candidatus Binatia bacterium]